MILPQLSRKTAATLVMYDENFPESAGTSYRRVAVKYTSVVVTSDKGKMGGSNVCLCLQGDAKTPRGPN